MIKKGFDRKRGTQKVREEKPAFLILTEDEKSLKNYIKGLIPHLGHNIRRFDIYSPGSSPKNIQAEAKKQYRNYKKTFCVFDKDSHDQKNNAYTNLINWIKTKSTKVVSINSVPCSEYWLYLHFEYCCAPLENKEKAEEKLKKHIKKYDKGTVQFTDYQDKLETAVENAKKSVQRYLADNSDDPMTRMGEFVEELKKISTK